VTTPVVVFDPYPAQLALISPVWLVITVPLESVKVSVDVPGPASPSRQ
jgi:hypothetical protein